jgi:hypothetical protein
MARARVRTWVLALGVGVLGGLMAGCAEKPQPRVAAMVPLASTGDYGYSETAEGPDRYTVRYTTPTLPATEDAAYAHGLEGEKQRAYDMALLRAAQLAQAARRPAFAVEQENRDVDVTVRRDAVYPTYVPSPFFYGGCWRWPCYSPWYPWGFYDYPYYRTRVTGRVVVDLKVRLLAEQTAEAFDTAATVERLGKAYTAASYPLTKRGY